MSIKTDSASNSSHTSVSKIPSDGSSPASSLRQQSKKLRSSKSSTISSHSSSQNESLGHPEGSVIETEQPEGCKCGPDLYNKVLGPTADESILTGIQTVIDLCSKLRTCNGESIQEIPERDNPPMKSTDCQTEKNTVSAGFQVNPSVRTEAVQTAGFPEMVSEILQTIGLDPETVSRVIQTSFSDVIQPKKASLQSIFMQTSNPSLRSGMIQTTLPDLPTIIEEPVETDTVATQSDPVEFLENREEPVTESVATQYDLIETNSASGHSASSHSASAHSASGHTVPVPLSTQSVETQCDLVETTSTMPQPPSTETLGTQTEIISYISRETMAAPVQETAKTQSSQIDVASKHTNTDEHKCISPPSGPCKCCSCSSASDGSKKGAEKDCICGPKRSLCRCSTTKKKSSFTMTGEQPPALETRYAVTRISKYKEFTTFEVMRSTRHKPRQIPKSVEDVFVLKKKNGAKDKSNSGDLKHKSNSSEVKEKSRSNELKKSRSGELKEKSHSSELKEKSNSNGSGKKSLKSNSNNENGSRASSGSHKGEGRRSSKTSA